jgi:stage III sporulation protein AE
MRKILFLLIIVVILPIFCVKIHAENYVDEYISDFENILPDEMGDMDVEKDVVETFSIEGILENIFSVISGERTRVVTFFLTLIGIIALSSLGTLAFGELSDVVRAVIGILSSMAIFQTVSSIVNEILSSLDKISSFFSSFIPISVALTALGGGESTAVVQGSGMYISLSLLSRLGGEVFSSVCAFGLASALLSPLGGQIISGVSSAVKNIFTRTLGIFTAIVTAAFSLQTLVSSSADSATMRAARYVASGLIPVVGSTVSGALSTLASGLSYAKGIIGGGAIAVILFFALSPLVALLLYRLALTVAIALSEMLSADCGVIFTAYRSALDMALAIYALSTLIYLFEIIIFIKSEVNLS